jgi:FMN reductase
MSRIATPVTLLVGHPRPGSRTLAVSRMAAATLITELRRRGTPVEPAALIDLARLLPNLISGRPDGGPVGQAISSLRGSRLLIVTSPTFKASYSGALKLLLDELPHRGLAGTVAVPLMTAASPQHGHIVYSLLRPLLLELGAEVPAAGLCVLEHHLANPQPLLDAWSAAAAEPLGAALMGRAAPVAEDDSLSHQRGDSDEQRAPGFSAHRHH